MRFGDAAATLAQSGQVNITLSDEDLRAIQRKALETGVSYQKLIADVVHQFVTGRLIERPGVWNWQYSHDGLPGCVQRLEGRFYFRLFRLSRK